MKLKANSPSAKVSIIFELDDNNWKEFYIQISKLTIINHNNYHISNIWILKVLNNIKLEPLNPSKGQIIHKNTYYTITKYVHMNGKVCTHTDTNNTPQNEGTFMVKWTPKVGHNTYCLYAKKNMS